MRILRETSSRSSVRSPAESLTSPGQVAALAPVQRGAALPCPLAAPRTPPGTKGLTMPAQVLTTAEFKDEVANRLDGSVSKADVNRVYKAIGEELADCLSNGYKVRLAGIGIFEPVHIPAKPRRKAINPFNPEEGEQWRAAKPAGWKVKIRASAALKKLFPSAKSKKGQELVAMLAPQAAKKASKKAKANGGAKAKASKKAAPAKKKATSKRK